MATDHHRGLHPRETAILALLTSVWGASFLFIKVAVDDVSPVGVALGRLVLATATIGGWLLVRRGPKGVRAMLAGVRPGEAAIFAATGSAAPFLLIAWSETRITSSLAGILNASIPLIAAGLALYLRDPGRIRGWRSAGLLLGFSGVALVAGGDLSGQPAGVVAMLAAAFLYATSAHLARRYFAGVEPQAVALIQVAVGFLLALPFLVFLRVDAVPPASAVASLVALGVGGTGIAYFLYYSLLSSAGPQHAVAVTYLVPIAAVIYGSLLLDEHVAATALVGMALILAGQVATSLPARRRAVDRLSPEAPTRPGAAA
ncbi:MAG: DMT family transporter [Acidimicrobiia bacterium]